MYKLYTAGNENLKWITLKSIFDDTGFSNIWNNQQNVNVEFLKHTIKQRLEDQFIQKWFTEVHNSSRGNLYSKFKKEFVLEPYLLRLYKKNRFTICKLRTSNLKIPIETGRWSNVPRNERFCNHCRDIIGNEYHYLFNCSHPQIVELRNKYIPTYYINNPSEFKMYGLLSLCNVPVMSKLASFIRSIQNFI